MKKSLFAIFFILLMTAMAGTSVVFYLKTHLYAEASENKTEVAVASTNAKAKRNIIYEYKAIFRHIKNGTEINTNKINPLWAHFPKTLYFYEELTQSDIILNGDDPFVRLSNGYFTFLFPYSHPTESWKYLSDFKTWLDHQNIQFLMLIAADKGDDSFSTFPKGLPTGYSRMAKEYKTFLDENCIAYLEAKQKLLAQNSNFYDWFYKTDHHWNVHAGRLMAEETAKRLREMQLATNPDAARKERFSLSVYPQSFLGSMGRKLGPKYKEDLEIYYPKDESRFHLEIPCLGINKIGSFEHTLINQQNIPQYAAFLYGDQPFIRIENMLSDDTTKALVIKQSKAEVFNPYFALTVRHLDIIDPRLFLGSIRSFIEQTQPDVVVICLDVMCEGTEKSWKLK